MSTASATSAFPGANREDRTAGFLSPKTITRNAIKVLAARGVEVRPAHVRRLVTAFVTEGHMTAAEIEEKAIAYSDPTGVEAARHLDRQQWALKARARSKEKR